MIKRLSALGRLDMTVFLIVASLFCFVISITRYVVTSQKLFLFLNRNLFLAFIPRLITSLIVLWKINNKYFLILLIAIWLLFFPNAPYIFTDLIHLQISNPSFIWFDLLLILCFAWTGIVYGFVSLIDIGRLLQKYVHPAVVHIITIFLLFLASFGVYLGRYMRWNTRDILNNPARIFSDISDRFINPASHLRTWGMTILM